tara:strand:- start:143 stop:580 length:438 start_codon:yes stop_codon:yes gene_type:complete
MALTKINNNTLSDITKFKVLQVVTATDLTQRSTTSTSFVTGSNTLSISITPSSASNKIYLVCTSNGFTTSQARYTIYKGATNLGTSRGMCEKQGGSWNTIAMSYLDSPSTTSATTYQVYFKNDTSGTTYLNSGNTASITAYEIAG